MTDLSPEAAWATIAAAEWELLEKPALVDGQSAVLAELDVLGQGLKALHHGQDSSSPRVRVALTHARDILIDSLLDSMKECPK